MILRAKLVIFFVLTLVALQSHAAGYLVQGIVRDSVTDTPLARASVLVEGGRSAVADERGIFEVPVSPDSRAMTVSCVGYAPKRVAIHRTSHNMYAVYLAPQRHELREIVVRRGKYSKKNNPAVDFARRIKHAGPEGDPMLRPNYSFNKYDRLTLALNNFSPEEMARLTRQFPYLAEHADTSDVTGRPILGLMLKERAARVFSRHPGKRKTVVDGLRSSGVDELLEPEATRTLLEDALREVDLYQNDINLLRNRFVSPLSPLAPDFYRFYLTDTVTMGDRPCAVLSFYPRNKTSFGFNGHLYVDISNDSAFVYKAEMRLPEGTAVNFVDNLFITQTFHRGPGGTRLKDLDDLVVELSALGGGKGGSLYARRTTTYTDHTFAPRPDSIFAFEGTELIAPEAEIRDSVFWTEARTRRMSRAESRIDSLMPALRQNRWFSLAERVLRTAFTGYIPLGNPAPVDFGPVNTVMSFNSLEGMRLRAGAMTTSNLSPRWFGRFYGAWGLRDHRWKYGAEMEYSFINKKHHSREFPVRSLRLSSQFDVDRPGVHYSATSPDNIVLSLRRMSDDRALYRWQHRLEFIWETRTNFSVNAAVAFNRFEQARTMPMTLGDGSPLPHYEQSVAEITLRYAPGEKFVQGRLHRVPVNFDAPAISLRHTCSPGGFLGSRYTVNRTVFEVQTRLWLSAFGFVDLSADAAHVWGRAPFASLLISNANLSYTIQPRSFALVNPMEFICSSAVSWDVTYHANGALLNLIPVVKRAHLREMVGFRGYWGRLDDACNPSLDPRLPQFPAGTGMGTPNHTPYMELSAGLENIFKVLQLEYVWRLTYRHVPYSIDRSGLRVAVKVDF